MVRYADIAELTDRQIFEHYFRPRDKHGVPKPIPNPVLYREVHDLDKMRAEFVAMSAGFGRSPQDTDAMWKEYIYGG